jgi:hypothetical protein
MTRHCLIPLGDLEAGEHVSDSVAVPDGSTTFSLQLQRCTPDTPDVWPDKAQAADLYGEILDGSAPEPGWQYVCHATYQGDVFVHRHQGVMPYSTLAPIDKLLPSVGVSMRVYLVLSLPTRTSLWVEVG